MNSSNFEQPSAHWRLGTTRLNSILSIILTSPRDNNPHFLLSTRIWPYLRVSRILNWRCSNIYSSKIRLICSADFLLCILALKAISLTTSNQLWKFYHVLYVRPLKNFGSWINAPTRGIAHVTPYAPRARQTPLRLFFRPYCYILSVLENSLKLSLHIAKWFSAFQALKLFSMLLGVPSSF